MADSTVPVPAVVPGSSVVKPFDADAESVAADRAAVAADRAAVAADRAAVAVDRARAQAARATAVAARGLVAVDRAAVAVDRAAVAADRAAAATSASAAATGRALIQSATAAIAAVSVPALPWLIDGLPPSVLLLAGSGAMMLGGLYVADSDILTVSSAAKWVEGFDGTLYQSPANQIAYNWRPVGGVRVREILIEPAGATNTAPYSEDLHGSPASSTLTASPVTLRGRPATRWTSTAVSGNINLTLGNRACAAGEKMTLSLAVQGVASRSTCHIGILGSVTGWGASGSSTAQIVSGPGSISVSGYGAGLWDVSGLSASEPTVIHLTRTHASAETSTALIYHSLDDGASDVAIDVSCVQFESGAVATSYIPTTGTAATRIADDVRLTTAALAQAATAAGATIVMSGSAYGADWLIGGSINSAIAFSSGLYRSDGGETVVVPGLSGALASYTLALACAPARRSGACNGGPVASSGASALWGLADETSIRLGADPSGGGASAQIYLRSLRIHPYIASDTSLQAASEV